MTARTHVTKTTRRAAPPRCTTCGVPLRWQPTPGHTPGGLRCPNSSHPRTDAHPHHLPRSSDRPAITPARVAEMLPRVEDSVGVLAGDVRQLPEYDAGYKAGLAAAMRGETSEAGLDPAASWAWRNGYVAGFDEKDRLADAKPARQCGQEMTS